MSDLFPCPKHGDTEKHWIVPRLGLAECSKCREEYEAVSKPFMEIIGQLNSYIEKLERKLEVAVVALKNLTSDTSDCNSCANWPHPDQHEPGCIIKEALREIEGVK